MGFKCQLRMSSLLMTRFENMVESQVKMRVSALFWLTVTSPSEGAGLPRWGQARRWKVTWSAKHVQLEALGAFPCLRTCSWREEMDPPWGSNDKRQVQWISGSHGLNSVFLLFRNELEGYEARKRGTSLS